MNYRIYYEGYAEVEADSIEEAEDLFWDEADDYREHEIIEIKNYDEDEIEW